ncbi:NADH dehydrogenase (ubiquinone) 1 alpha/beta subcomplex 1 [Schistosoma bovis]|uniref:Acyl carrier protein n=1 Tax=Schistosoma bovis TaxID=6184 RepID=A0A430QCN3_SCHBO|nr:NADH dehydrogenase (ubiquinone) 1 alpha/beta subcomplex 1 [Schistosoma bovis]
MQLTLDSSFIKDLGLDSLDHIEVIMEIENEFRNKILNIFTTFGPSFPNGSPHLKDCLNVLNEKCPMIPSGFEISDVDAEKLHTPRDIVEHVYHSIKKAEPSN